LSKLNIPNSKPNTPADAVANMAFTLKAVLCVQTPYFLC
jgi:hypothetical protein